MLQKLKPDLVYLCFLMLLIFSCAKDSKTDPFEIASKKVGVLTPNIKVSQLDSVFQNDSIVFQKGNQKMMLSSTIEIYEKGGEKLLILEPSENENPDATVQYIQIIDPRYRTASGVSNASVFKDIKDKYKVSKINNMLATVVIFVDSIQATFTIDKKELPLALRSGTSAKIEASQIPDSAKIKHFMISWDKN